MSRKKVARELPQKRRKRPTLLKKSNHASRATRTSERSQPNNVLDNIRKSKTWVDNPNFLVYSNPTKTQEMIPKLVSDSTFVPKTPKPRTWRNPTLLVPKPNPNFAIPDYITIPTTVPLLILLLPAMSIFE